jgi:hypothetical protein
MKKIKFKFNVKEFDYKQFFLKYGEWIGLGIALVITLPVVFSGVGKILGSGSPTTNANDVKQQADGVDRAIKSSEPSAEAKAQPTLVSLEMKYKKYVDYEAYATKWPWFIPSTLEDTKRRNPEILSPVELRAHVLRADIPINIINDEEKKILVIQDKKVELPEKLKQRLRLLGQLRGGSSGGGGMGPGRGGGQMGGRGAGGGMMGGAGAAGRMKEQMTKELRWVDLDKFDITEGVVPAEQIYPTHMVIISGCFPFKEQLENFRRALRKSTLREFLAMIADKRAYWDFKEIVVERQVLRNGKIETPWEPYTEKLIEATTDLLSRATGTEEEDRRFTTVEYILNHGLVMPRPKLAQGKKFPETYPPEDLPGIEKTLATLSKTSNEPAKRELSVLAQKGLKKGIDPWDPFSPIGNDEPTTKTPGTPAQPGQPAQAGQMGQEPPKNFVTKMEGVQPMELVKSALETGAVPEMALIRIVDMTVRPGYTYQYRLKVKMINPNYHQGNVVSRTMRDIREITAKEWTTVPPVEVPPDSYWCLRTDKHDNDKVMLQVQRWLENVPLDPKSPGSTVPVADWAILESLQGHKGEYIGGVHQVKVPIWKMEAAKYDLARSPRSGRPTIPVDFSVRNTRSQDPALIVDFEGGKGTKVQFGKRVVTEDLPVQLLILSPDGKLVVRNTEEDFKNEEWQKRYTQWKEWVNELEKGKKPKIPQGLFDQRGGPSQ